jgi:hypothetical protein
MAWQLLPHFSASWAMTTSRGAQFRPWASSALGSKMTSIICIAIIARMVFPSIWWIDFLGEEAAPLPLAPM